ncbi:PTS-dependent dihydroxyacetone kinase, dihydroxyacetone-binding subunit DhaK [Arthrobacter sp. Hiyo4]|nr:PTS-dependent dihydroxyacetone kinase, dihydroxyacetone-binding subunit DhaK [Arthrobacter sp. Hiyo4]
MKKLINDPRSVVDESVEGFGLAHAGLVTVIADPKYVARKDAPVAGKVGLVSGGEAATSRSTQGLSGWECSTPPCRGGVHLADAGPDSSGDARR